MLAGTLTDLSKLKYPLLVTPKLDGIRCLVISGAALSRKLLPIPNKYIQDILKSLPDGLDGELIIPGATFNQIQSAVMSVDGKPNFVYVIFDYVKSNNPKDLKAPYTTRMMELSSLPIDFNHISKLFPTRVLSESELITAEETFLSQGYEGLMMRSLSSPYKFGRSTEKEQFLLKMKRFEDSEAIIIGFEEQLTNLNELTKDELGHAKRSSHKENLISNGLLGKFLVREVGNTPWKGQEFAIGSGKGLTDNLRALIWTDREHYLGKLIKYKYQPHGIKDLPRLPIFLSFRHEID